MLPCHSYVINILFLVKCKENLSACPQWIPTSVPNCSSIDAVLVTVESFSRDKWRIENSLFPWKGNSLSWSGVFSLYSLACFALKSLSFSHVSSSFSAVMFSSGFSAGGIWFRATSKGFKYHLPFALSHIAEWLSSPSQEREKIFQYVFIRRFEVSSPAKMVTFKN